MNDFVREFVGGVVAEPNPSASGSSLTWLKQNSLNQTMFTQLRRHFTMWKFHKFSITQILREINFWDSQSAKSAISSHLEVLYFQFMNFCHSEI